MRLLSEYPIKTVSVAPADEITIVSTAFVDVLAIIQVASPELFVEVAVKLSITIQLLLINYV